MTQNPPALPVRPPRLIPVFHAVPGKARGDGWTPLRQAEFIGNLAETRCVSEAARRVGMTRETAYRLRRRKWSASFCLAWDAAMGRQPMLFRPKFAGAGMVATRLASLGLRGGSLALAPQIRLPAAVTHAPAKVTVAELEWRLESGLWKVLLHRGRYIGVRQKADDSALLRLVARADRVMHAARSMDRSGQRSRV